MDFVVKIENVNITVCLPPGLPPWRLKTFGPVKEQNLPGLEKGEPMEGVLTNTQEADFVYPEPVDKKGQPAPVQAGSVKLSSSDETVLVVVQDPTNPYKGIARAVGNGTADVNIEADADMGDGVTLIHGEPIHVTVTGGQAVGFGSPSFGPPREQ